MSDQPSPEPLFTRERVLRGIPRWLLRGYLEDLSGVVADLSGRVDVPPDHDELQGVGWRATLTQIEDYRIGSLSSGQVRFVVTGDEPTVTAMLTKLEPRLFRGGG